MPTLDQRTSNSARSCLSAAAFVACAQAALAQQPPAKLAAAAPADSASAPQQLAPVQVLGNYQNAVGTTDAASAGTVTSKLLESRPTLRPAEVLEFVPGVIVTQHSGDGKANQYFLRGFNLDHGTDFATFVDEMPINMRTHAHGQGYTDLNFVIPELVKSIAYKKGPYYAEEGDFASAGAAHMSLFNSLPRGIATVTVGENNYQRAVLAASTRLGPGNLLYGLELAHNDGPWDNPEKFRKASGVLRYSVGPEDNRYSVTAMAYSAKWNSTDQIPQRAVDSGLIGQFGAIDPTDGGESARYSLSFDWKRRTDNAIFQFNAYAMQ